MTTHDQLALWELEYLKTASTNTVLSYIYKYIETDNPFVDEAIDKLSKNLNSGYFNRNRQYFIWEKAYNSCKTQKDYENYFIKYNGNDNNPFIERAKAQIEIRNGVPLVWRLIIMIILFAISGGLMYLSFLGDGTSNSFIAICCAASMLASIAIFICGIIFVCSPTSFIHKD